MYMYICEDMNFNLSAEVEEPDVIFNAHCEYIKRQLRNTKRLSNSFPELHMYMY